MRCCSWARFTRFWPITSIPFFKRCFVCFRMWNFIRRAKFQNGPKRPKKLFFKKKNHIFDIILILYAAQLKSSVPKYFFALQVFFREKIVSVFRETFQIVTWISKLSVAFFRSIFCRVHLLHWSHPLGISQTTAAKNHEIDDDLFHSFWVWTRSLIGSFVHKTTLKFWEEIF